MDSLTKLRRIETNEQYVKENKLAYSDLSSALLCKHFT